MAVWIIHNHWVLGKYHINLTKNPTKLTFKKKMWAGILLPSFGAKLFKKKSFKGGRVEGDASPPTGGESPTSTPHFVLK